MDGTEAAIVARRGLHDEDEGWEERMFEAPDDLDEDDEGFEEDEDVGDDDDLEDDDDLDDDEVALDDLDEEV